MVMQYLKDFFILGVFIFFSLMVIFFLVYSMILDKLYEKKVEILKEAGFQRSVSFYNVERNDIRYSWESSDKKIKFTDEVIRKMQMSELKIRIKKGI